MLLRRMMTPVAVLALGVATGCGSSGETITGTVGIPGSAQGIVVGIRSGGLLQTVTTGNAGSFSVSGVTLPYDAMVVINNSVLVLQGLTVLHPTLASAQYEYGYPPNGPAHGATLQGSVTPPPGTPALRDLEPRLRHRGRGVSGVGQLTTAVRPRLCAKRQLVWASSSDRESLRACEPCGIPAATHAGRSHNL